MPIDQDVALIVARLAEADLPAFESLSPDKARELSGAMQRLSPPGPDIARVENLKMADAGGREIGARLYAATDSPSALMIYYHGGGWVLGNLDSHDAMLRALALYSGVAILSVDYRLAPEHPFPAAVDDAYAALEYAAANCAALLGSEIPLIVGGDSAGANLATVAALRSCASGSPSLAFQLLLYPVTAADFDTPSYLEHRDGPILTRAAMQWFWNHYLPDVSERRNPCAAPLHDKNLSGLPPTLIQTAEFDPLRDEGEAYATRLSDAGVRVTLQRREGLPHGYCGMFGVVPAADSALRDVAAALRVV